MRLLRFSWMISLTFTLACVDECTPAEVEPRCEGNTVVSCPERGVDQLFGTHITRRPCNAGSVCVDLGQRNVFCALSTEPERACLGEDGGTQSGNVCADATHQMGCWSGYATYKTECLSCTKQDAGLDCMGSYGSSCRGNAECTSGLICGKDGYCAYGAD